MNDRWRPPLLRRARAVASRTARRTARRPRSRHVPAAPPRAALILRLVVSNQRALDAHELEHARQHDIEPLAHERLVHLRAAKHRLRAEPVERLEAVPELPAGHAGIARAVVVVRIANRAPLDTRSALVVLLAQPPLQVVRELLDHVAAGDADCRTSRLDVEDPGKDVRDEPEARHAWECGGLLPAVGPGTMGRVSRAMAVRGGEEHVPTEVRSLVVVDRKKQRVDLQLRADSLDQHWFEHGAICIKIN